MSDALMSVSVPLSELSFLIQVKLYNVTIITVSVPLSELSFLIVMIVDGAMMVSPVSVPLSELSFLIYNEMADRNNHEIIVSVPLSELSFLIQP